jgi:hypothetical protein
MNNLEAASSLVEMYGHLTTLEDHRGCLVAPEYAEAISLAIMALKENRND